MVMYNILPVDKTLKSACIKKYSPNEEDGRSRNQADSQRKKDDKNRDVGIFEDMLAAKKQQQEKSDGSKKDMAVRQSFKAFEPQPFSPYLRAKILSSTLAFELMNMEMAE